MARNEFTTDVPEHSDLQPSLYWDRRARGLGATPSRPAVSCGEENLLCTAGDPYNTENILIHEFAHALHEMAIKPTFPAFQNELDECFRLAIEEKIWEGTYASTNSSEYWAECVQSWFHQPGNQMTMEPLIPERNWWQAIRGCSTDRSSSRQERLALSADQQKLPGHLRGFDRRRKKPSMARLPRSVENGFRAREGEPRTIRIHKIKLMNQAKKRSGNRLRLERDAHFTFTTSKTVA